ncbi:MAG: hypothetical protein KJ048_10620 [Dehalococcoidia bacterium]|nr:hypothetical protein [Dehalococcoidia bacterium]
MTRHCARSQAFTTPGMAPVVWSGAMERHYLGLGSTGIAAILAFTALAVPPLAFDHTASAPPEAVNRLKVQAAHVRTIPPLVSRVTHAEQFGPTPDHVRGRVVARTLFGIRIGWYELSAEGNAAWHYDRRKELALAAAFLLAEAGLLGSAVWLFATSR